MAPPQGVALATLEGNFQLVHLSENLRARINEASARTSPHLCAHAEKREQFETRTSNVRLASFGTQTHPACCRPAAAPTARTVVQVATSGSDPDC